MTRKTRTPAQEAAEVAEALRLHSLGMTTTAIAVRMTADGQKENDSYSISQPTVHRRIQAGLERLVIPATQEAQKAELARLDAYLEALASKLDAGDVQAIKTAVSIGERRAKLLGLDKVETKADAPAKVPAIVKALEARRAQGTPPVVHSIESGQ